MSSSAALTYSITDFLELGEEETRYHRSVAIYALSEGEQDAGEPVCWIELLSPSNKPGGQDSNYYQEKRRRIHQSRASCLWKLIISMNRPRPFSALPSSINSEASNGQPDLGVSAYRIVVIEPRPDFAPGEIRSVSF